MSVIVGRIPGFLSISMAHLLEANENGETANDYGTVVAASPDEVTGKLVSGELDAATLPTNTAAILYNRTQGEVLIAAVNTLGVIKIVTDDPEITELSDLVGQQIDASGRERSRNTPSTTSCARTTSSPARTWRAPTSRAMTRWPPG
ncbi:MAG: hypothetical protein ACOX61_08985 [Brooklawnia sp.]